MEIKGMADITRLPHPPPLLIRWFGLFLFSHSDFLLVKPTANKDWAFLMRGLKISSMSDSLLGMMLIWDCYDISYYHMMLIWDYYYQYQIT